MNDWISPLVGLAGVALGAGIVEMFRRGQRIEQFAGQVFAKRLEVYEGLWQILQAGQSAIGIMLDDDDMTPSDRHEIVSSAVMTIAHYTDRHSLYLEQEVVVQCCSVFMGTEDIPGLSEQERDAHIARYERQWRVTRQLIMESSGMVRINATFGNINKPQYKSIVVDHFKRLRAEQAKADAAGDT